MLACLLSYRFDVVGCNLRGEIVSLAKQKKLCWMAAVLKEGTVTRYC